MTEPTYTIEQLTWLQLRDERGEEVTFRRGDLIVEGIVVVFTRPQSPQVAIGEQVQLAPKQLDCLVAPDDLVDESGERIEPRRGDVFVRKSGEIRKVNNPSTANDVWRWSDGKQTWRRIITEGGGTE